MERNIRNHQQSRINAICSGVRHQLYVCHRHHNIGGSNSQYILGVIIGNNHSINNMFSINNNMFSINNSLNRSLNRSKQTLEIFE